MNELKIFENTEFGQMRTIEEDGKVLFCGSDCAKMLGYTNPNKAVNDHCRAITKCSTPISGKMQEINFITEGDLYRLIAHSKLPAAEKFEGWVFDEVLPSIRKHGGYIAGQENMSDEELVAKAYIVVYNQLKEREAQVKNLEAEKSALTVENQIMKPKADYFDDLVERNLLTGIRETAKMLGIQQKVFVDFMLEKKYLYRDKKGKLMPYADKNNGLFEVKECKNDKTEWAGSQTMITPKGRETFNLLLIG